MPVYHASPCISVLALEVALYAHTPLSSTRSCNCYAFTLTLLECRISFVIQRQLTKHMSVAFGEMYEELDTVFKKLLPDNEKG